MALADLSVPNINVSYEIGIRHSFELPCAFIIDSFPNPFDRFDAKTVSFDLSRPNEFAKYRHEIAKALESATAARSGRRFR
jgi:hypothetical protein